MTISWRDVDMCDNDGDIPTGTNARRAQAMREYRASGCIDGIWLATREELAEADEAGEETADLGPSVDEIDWAGLGTAEDVARALVSIMSDEDRIRILLAGDASAWRDGVSMQMDGEPQDLTAEDVCHEIYGIVSMSLGPDHGALLLEVLESRDEDDEPTGATWQAYAVLRDWEREQGYDWHRGADGSS